MISITAFGLTYAYFLSVFKTNPKEESVTMTAGELKLTYYDGNSTIVLKNMKPDTTVDTKTFSVKNTGKINISNYGIYLEDVINELYYTEDLDYTLTCKEYDKNSNFISDCTGGSGVFFVTDDLLVSNSLNVGHVHEYELIIKYVESNKNQSIDMNKNVSGKIQIYDLKLLQDHSLHH